jgi:hypothetical protein
MAPTKRYPKAVVVLLKRFFSFVLRFYVGSFMLHVGARFWFLVFVGPEKMLKNGWTDRRNTHFPRVLGRSTAQAPNVDS